MSSSPIVINTTVDLGGIEKYNEAASSVAASNSRMAESFEQASAVSAGLESAERRVESVNERAAAQFNETAAAATEEGYSMREARGSARLLADELGVTLNRELADSISRSEILGPLIAKAFSVFAVVGFAEVLAEIPNAIEKIIEKLSGWDEEAKKAYEEMVRGNLEVMAQNRELEAQEARTATVGFEGSRKYAAELQNVKNEIHASGLESGTLLQALVRMHSEMDQLKPPIQATSTLGQMAEWTQRNVVEMQWLAQWLSGADTRYKDLAASAKAFNDQATKDTEEQKRMRVEEDKVKAEAAADATRQNIADQESRVEHARSAAEAIESYDRSVYEQRYRLGEISLAQETELLKQSEDRQFAAAEETYRKLRALTAAKGATGQDVTPELEKLDSEQEKLQADHYEKLNALDATYREQTKRNALADAEAQIEANEKIQESNLKLAETKEKFDFGHADSQAELEAAAIPYIQTTTQLYVAQIEALRRRQEELAKDPTPENARKIAELTAQEIVLANQSAQAIVGIENEKEEKIKGIRARDLENTVSTLNAELDVSSGHYQEGVSELQKSLSEKRISLSAYVTQAEELAGREYSAELATLEKETDAVRQAAAQKIITEQQASKQLEDIWKRETQIFNEEQKRREEVEKQAVQKEAEDIKRATDQIARDFTQAFNQIITGHEKVGQAAAKLGQELVLYIIDQGIKKVVSTYATDLLQMLAAHESWLANLLGIQTAGDAAQAAQTKAAALVQAQALAGEAAAGAFASVMVALPFPLNVSTAPEVAGAAAAQTEALAAFERGGIVPNTETMAVLHPREMVLPEHISSFVQEAAAHAPGAVSNSTSSSSTTVHNHINVSINHQGTNLTHDDIVRSVKTAVRRGQL